MIKNQNILAKTSMKSFIQKRQTSKTATGELFNETSNKKNSQVNNFHHCQANIFLEKVTKFIISQTNIKFSGNNSLTAKLYKHLSNELSFNVYQ